jgi:hypothetical protein
MKFTMQVFHALAVSGLLIGTTATTPVFAAGKKAQKTKETNIFTLIDADLKSLDKALFGPPKQVKTKKH